MAKINKTRVLSFRVTDETYAEFEMLRAAAGCRMSELIETMCKNYKLPGEK